MGNDNFILTDEIISNARETMGKLVDNIISLKIEDIETYEFPQGQLFGLEIINDNALFYLFIRFSHDNKNFICMNPNLFDRECKNPPYFARWSWYKYFNESFIATADPMVFRNDKMKGGMMIGVKNQWYAETLSCIISKLAKNQNVIEDNILFFGSSAGGFISLCLATLIKNSKVLINNSQFNLKNYNKYVMNMIFDAIAPTFEGLSNEEIMRKYGYRFNFTELIERENYAPYITYYVNVKSKSDKNQSIPFIQEYYDQKEFNGLNIIFYSEEKEKPHTPLPNDISIEFIRLFAKNNLYNLKPNIQNKLINEEKYPKELENKIKELENKIKELENKIKKLKNQNRQIKNSNSWKITKPLRYLTRQIQKIIKIFKK